MKYYRGIAAAIMLFSNTLWAQQDEKGLEVTHLKGDFYVYTTYGTLDNGDRYPSNSLYVVTDKGVVLVDVPWDTTQAGPLLQLIEQQHHKKVIACISTHFHDDRTAGVDFLGARGIRTYATAQTRELCRKEHNEVPEFSLPADTIFDLGNHRMRVYYPGAGHSPDNIVVGFPEDGVLFGGCLVKSTEAGDLGNLSDARPEAWEATLKNVQEQFPGSRYMIPGHGAWKSRKALEHTGKLVRAYLAGKAAAAR